MATRTLTNGVITLLLTAVFAAAAWAGTTLITYGNRIASLEAVMPLIEKHLDSIDRKLDRVLDYRRGR